MSETEELHTGPPFAGVAVDEGGAEGGGSFGIRFESVEEGGATVVVICCESTVSG